MIVIPNCVGTTPCRGTDSSGAREGAVHSQATGVCESIPEGPVGEFQSRPGLYGSPVERGGCGTGRDNTFTGGIRVSGDDEPGTAARLAEPGLLWLIDHLDYQRSRA